jgi:GH35 family endo-1,4-beta-xylanase
MNHINPYVSGGKNMTNRRKILDLFEANAEWTKKRVDEGIERHRKGDAKLKVVDGNGNPLSNVKIKINQTSHAFRFGSNIFMLDELETEEKNDEYKRRFADVFNMATLPFYWGGLEPIRNQPRYAKDSPRIYRRPSPDRCIEFCEAHGIEPREHALAYDQFFPDWITGLDEEETEREYERHFAEIAERYADKIPTIEVVNEMEWPVGKSVLYDRPDFIEWCFKLAEKYFPDNELVINEHSIPAWEGQCRTADKYYAFIEANLLKGARIDAVGMQFHLFNKREEEYANTRKMLDPVSLYKHMDLYALLGKPLQITEVTIPSYSWENEDEQVQADLLENLYSIWFSHPAVEQIIYWNLVDGYAHVQEDDPAKIRATQGDMSRGENYYHGGLLRFDLSPKPAYERLKKLTQEVWHTECELVTDEHGEVNFRGFFGDYNVEIMANGLRTDEEIKLSKSADTDFVLKVSAK